MITIGFDAGNSETTIAVRASGRVQCLTFPSYLGSGDYAELLRVRSGAGRNATLDPDEYAIEHRGASLFAGKLALEQSRDATTGRGSTARYSGGHTLRLLLAACGKLFKEDVTIRVITGLPVNVFSEIEKAQVRASLCGTHAFTFNGKPREITVDAVGVMMEGAAVLYDVATEAVDQCVIDVGGGSTDLFWAVGRKPRYERCDGLGVGVEKIGELLNKRLATTARRLTGAELREQLWAWATRSTPPPLYHRAKSFVLNGELPEASAQVGDELATWISGRWADTDGVATAAAHARLIGGGAYYVRQALKRAIPHLVVPDRPERANALAYLAIAEAATEEAWSRNRG